MFGSRLMKIIGSVSEVSVICEFTDGLRDIFYCSDYSCRKSERSLTVAAPVPQKNAKNSWLWDRVFVRHQESELLWITSVAIRLIFLRTEYLFRLVTQTLAPYDENCNISIFCDCLILITKLSRVPQHECMVNSHQYANIQQYVAKQNRWCM